MRGDVFHVDAQVRIHILAADTITTEVISYTLLTLATTVLTVMSAGTALYIAFLGKGEFDPTGLLWKFFYMGNAVLKDTPTTKTFKGTAAVQDAGVVQDDTQYHDNNNTSSDEDEDEDVDEYDEKALAVEMPARK